MKRHLLVLPVLALGLATACSGGSSSATKNNGAVDATGPTSAQTAVVHGLDTLKFSPNIVHAKVGTLALTFTNDGGVAHNLVFDDPAFGMTPTVNGHTSKTLDITFTKPGTYPFVCTFHNGMTGEVIVS